MARRLDVEITGDSSNFTQATADAADASDKLRGTWGTLDSEMEDLRDSFDTLAAKMDPDSSGVFDVDDAFGNLERVLIGVGDQLGVLEEQFGVPIGPMKEYTQAAADVAGGMEGIIGGGRALVTQFGNLAPSLGPAIAATWGHVTALTAQAAAMIAANWPIILIIGSIALLAAGIYLLVQHWDTIVEKVPLLGAAVTAVKEIVTGDFSSITGAFTAILDFAREHWPEIAVILSGPFAPLVILATDGFGIRTAMINFATALPGEIAGAIGDTASTLRDKGTGMIQGFADGMSEKFLDAWNWAVAVPGEIVSAIGDVGRILWQKGRDIIQGLIDGMKSIDIPNPVDWIPGSGAVGDAISKGRDMLPQVMGGGGGGGDVPAPRVGDVRDGLVWTADGYWSQAGARRLNPGEYTGFVAPTVIQLTLDGEVIAEAVHKAEQRGY